MAGVHRRIKDIDRHLRYIIFFSNAEGRFVSNATLVHPSFPSEKTAEITGVIPKSPGREWNRPALHRTDSLLFHNPFLQEKGLEDMYMYSL